MCLQIEWVNALNSLPRMKGNPSVVVGGYVSPGRQEEKSERRKSKEREMEDCPRI